jgi:Tfp pilus assembly protein PilF
MPLAGHHDAERAKAHARWAEWYNDQGRPSKAAAHFGRALHYGKMADAAVSRSSE